MSVLAGCLSPPAEGGKSLCRYSTGSENVQIHRSWPQGALVQRGERQNHHTGTPQVAAESVRAPSARGRAQASPPSLPSPGHLATWPGTPQVREGVSYWPRPLGGSTCPRLGECPCPASGPSQLPPSWNVCPSGWRQLRAGEQGGWGGLETSLSSFYFRCLEGIK